MKTGKGAMVRVIRDQSRVPSFRLSDNKSSCEPIAISGWRWSCLKLLLLVSALLSRMFVDMQMLR